MMRLFKLAPVAALLSLSLAPLPAAAQALPPITAEEARQCALWSAFLADQANGNDAEAEEALLFMTNYFVGLFEGMSGLSIEAGDDMSAVVDMASNMEEVTAMCQGHAMGYGQRMQAWGNRLQEAGGVAK